MAKREDYIEQCLDPSKRNLDRNRGIQIGGFAEALKRAAGDEKVIESDNIDSDKKNNPNHCSENCG